MSDPYVSLASSTSTSIETASKHNLQCRVSTDHIMQWVQDSSTTGESAQSILKKEQMNYCMHKNDIVVGVRQGWHSHSVMLNKAYPHVITTYAGMSPAAQYWLLRLYNNCKDMRDVRFFVNEPLVHRVGIGAAGTSELLAHERQQIENMPQFYFMGVSLGLAYAHPDSGDTVGTVMMGGLRTVLNGHFSANTGQPVQWYFEFEAPCFDSYGQRIFFNKELPNVVEDGMMMVQSGVNNAPANLDMNTLDRKVWHERENANFPRHVGKRHIIYLKPYKRNDDGEENILDRERICGIYISSGRPFEQIDVKLQRQAI